MTLTKKKIQQIIDLFQKGFSIKAIADKLNLVRNTVKNILRRNDLLPYSYPKSQQYGPPSPFGPNTFLLNK